MISTTKAQAITVPAEGLTIPPGERLGLTAAQYARHDHSIQFLYSAPGHVVVKVAAPVKFLPGEKLIRYSNDIQQPKARKARR
jgi:hypothetical protein